MIPYEYSGAVNSARLKIEVENFLAGLANGITLVQISTLPPMGEDQAKAFIELTDYLSPEDKTSLDSLMQAHAIESTDEKFRRWEAESEIGGTLILSDFRAELRGLLIAAGANVNTAASIAIQYWQAQSCLRCGNLFAARNFIYNAAPGPIVTQEVKDRYLARVDALIASLT